MVSLGFGSEASKQGWIGLFPFLAYLYMSLVGADYILVHVAYRASLISNLDVEYIMGPEVEQFSSASCIAMANFCCSVVL